MTNINKVSQAVTAQSPEFIQSDYPLFTKFIEYYYKSQEKTGLGQNILNGFLNYLDIDRLDIGILDGATKLVEAITTTSDKITVESVDSFLASNGSILIGTEVIYYESTTNSPNIALSPGVSYEQVKLKWVNLASPMNSFNGSDRLFPLISQDNPVAPPSPQHLIVSVYGEVLTPGTDYTISGTNINFAVAPRTKTATDDSTTTYITYLNGFVESNIVAIDDISNSFGDSKRSFALTRSGAPYEPIVDEYVIAVYDKRLLTPKVDFFIDGDDFIFLTAPTNGRFLSLYSIEAPVPSFGSGAKGYARVNDTGELTSISTNANGTGYRFEYPPKVSINTDVGKGGSATALVNGVKSITLLKGGKGYSDSNPPVVQIQEPTKDGSSIATMKATVTNGSVSAINLTGSGSGYTFTPRITFRQPGGATVATPTLNAGSISGGLTIVDTGFGYTTPPSIYVDEPTGTNGIRASFQTVLAADGTIASITTLNAGQGYETVPRVSIVDPVGAQILETVVDGDGRVIRIDLLDGGSGYDEVPSVYIVDKRVDGQGNYAGGTGAIASASIFNGKITDINVSAFGSGYSAAAPPTVVIQAPPSAEASADIGVNEVTGFKVLQSGSGYNKAQFVGCARSASAITSYSEDGNAIFSNDTTAAAAIVDTPIKCLDSLFVKRLLDKYTEQFLPDVPELDYSKIDVRTAIKTVKDFYSSKGTSFSIAYLFKLLYGESVSISYPKDQIIKPSDATWSIDTILRATLVSGLATDIQDGLLVQEADIADANVAAASALVENYISIKTSETEIFELVLSEETITGTFTVPYKTKLAEPLSATDSIITVDSTIGWPERNGEFVIGTGTGAEVVQYKEKSLNQFIECTRSFNGVVEDWDSATEVASNFKVYINKGTSQEVVMNVVGIVDAQQTSLTDTGSYYLPGDKLTVSKLGGTGISPLLTTWLYNVKKLISVTSITYGGVNDQSATVTCANNHGLLVGDQVTIYGANPIIYNGTFLVTSRDSETVFQYQLVQPGTTIPQGNILVSVDLNKGKSNNTAILNAVGPYTTNIQNSFFNDNYTYVAATGIPNYAIGPFPGSALLPGNQRKLNRFPAVPTTISTKNAIVSGSIGTWVNGVSVWSYKSTTTKTFGAVTGIDISNSGKDYDAASPPVITIDGGGGSGAAATVTVDGSISEITVTAGGSGYTSSPLVSIVGGDGSGAAATAIITKGAVSRILINQGGSGYTSQPSITIVGGGGAGAAGTASVRGPIQSVNISSGGASYTSIPTVSLSSGSGAVAQPIVSNGRIISIAIISAGSGYTTAPEVSIQGVGFGAIARATIDTDGENAGRVTSITIVNRGIGYVQGTTLINLTSVGQDASFAPSVFKWTYNLQATATLDAAKGGVFEGYNNQYGGEYAHLSNPQRLRYILGDNLQEITAGNITEQDSQLTHSPIIGWAFDGNPIYGPYGYTDPTDQSSSITRLRTSYRLKTNLVYDGQSNPYPERTAGPLLNAEPAGNFVEDYEYVFNLGDLDQYNGRFCKTPDYPQGRYVYFVTIDASEAGVPEFPYVLGPNYNSVVDPWNLSTSATQQNIPIGVVRYRDPYENVDIDVERTPNASTNALTTENGEILLFDAEDTNRDGVISADEQDLTNLGQLFEESPLQLFDYFPKVKFDSKVDIEVETTTKFEDASVTGFTVENPGISYQVNDRLVFDNTDTDGSGVSARVSRIKGETVEAYTFESISGNNFGVLTTVEPHNLGVGDSVFIDYTPVMDNTNKSFVVRQYQGIEEIQITQTGSGYNEDIPPTIIIDSDSGKDGILQAVVTSVGSIDTVNILNSGSGYTSNPRVILSHPQIYKKADYYLSFINNNNYVQVNDVFVNTNKEVFICGKTKDASANVVAFVSKLSATGVKEWEKTLESSDGLNYTEFNRLYVDGDAVWVVGINKPNSSLLNAYNPDIILCKYTQAANGLSATLNFQKAYAGISGSTRGDNVTVIKKYSDTRFLIGGYTNTNSVSPDDAFIASIDTSGNFAIKRKFASANKHERITDIHIDGTDVYFSMETGASLNAADTDVAVGKCQIGTNAITVDWINGYSNTLYSLRDVSLCMDEFQELYITATCRLKSDDTTRDSVWVGKINASGTLIWNYRYVAPGREVTAIRKSVIDIFGDLNIGFTRDDNTNEYRTVDTLKIGYNGVIKNHTTTEFDADNIEGLYAHTLDVDNSGDIHVFGQTAWNRNEFVVPFTSSALTDTTAHYTAALTSTGDSFTYDAANGWGKILGAQTASPTSWVNTNIKFTAAELGTKLAGDFTLEFFIFKDSTNTNKFSQPKETLCAIGDGTTATGGLHLFYDQSSAGPSGPLTLTVTNNTTTINAAGSSLTSTQTNLYADNTWQAIALVKSGNTFTVYVNGISVATGTIANTALGAKDLHFGNIPGADGTTGSFRSNEQGQFHIDHLRLRNRAVTPSVPSDITALPTAGAFGLTFDWGDDAWFADHLSRYDYIDYAGFGIKSDKDADATRLGDKGKQTNSGVSFVRTAVTPVVGSSLTMSTAGYALGDAGYQSLDFDDTTTTMNQDTETLTYVQDVWSSRTATVPSPGSQKLKVTAVVKNRYYFKVTPTIKIDNIQELTINQAFNFSVGSKLVLKNTGGTFVNSGYIIRKDTTNNKLYLAVNNNTWTNDLNTGRLTTEQFNEQSTYGITGDIPNDINEIQGYTFATVNNTTPGTFDIDLDDYNLDGLNYNAGGGQNLDSYAVFKPYSDDDYSVRIDEVAGGSAYIVGSVINIPSGNITYNAGYSTAQITGLTGVLKITLVTNLTKILQVSAVANSDEVYVITDTSHYLSAGDMIYVDGNPSQTVGSTVYDEYDGAFAVNSVVSPLEFTYKLKQAAITDPATTAANVNIFVKSPTLKMYYGHQYLFDLSHSSMAGGNLSFAKDNLYKLEYSFNSIERVGTPGVTGGGQPTPTVKLKVDTGVVTNISYYFDPSRTGDDSPVVAGSYLDVVNSPYKGTFEISAIAGATITRGADIIKFPLLHEPEGAATIAQASYSTSSVKAVGSISDIRIVNPGGFYTKLPIVSSITSSRQIERIQINDPGTEYAVGQYDSVPIAGNGEGGFVQIIVSDGTDADGNVIPGQISAVNVTSPGKGYTTASIDINSIEGILGAGLTGSGAELVVVIPAFGTGASIFTKGDKVGKIKKLKNNNFGYDYPHDYTLRPEITFPINAQLTSTSILDSITITDPGTGYSQAPAVIITGGGGSGAVAEATIKNGRLDVIIVKDPGAGYSSTPTVSLRSSFNYVVNLDLGLLQFAFPHGIQNGAAVTVSVTDTGDGADFPLAAGATGRLNASTTYYAIAGTANSLEGDQLKLAITAANAELGDALSFVNAGTGRQSVLTESFGGAATANVVTSTFLEGELVYQGDSLTSATATGYVSENSGWQIGPRVLKIVDYTGEFSENQRITGVISKSSGLISDLKIAKGVLEIGSITKTTGQFIDDVGKPSEIIQKIQDSYYYQDFSYAVKSSTSISEWKEILIKNVHPASFKVFGELNLNEYGYIPNKETFFQLTKSVELAQEAIVPNIQNFALVEPVYSEFNNTEVLFRQKRLTSSENILTSVVQRIDDVSSLFDGERISFPLTVNGDNVVANANQLMIVLNGVVQTPGTSFSIQQDSIVFSEAPQPPASVKYVNVVINQIQTVAMEFTNISGIFPNVSNDLVGTSSNARLTTTSVVGNTVNGFIVGSDSFIVGELVTVSATGFSANVASVTNVVNQGLFVFNEKVTNFQGDTAQVEAINLQKGQETPLAQLRYTIGLSTTSVEVVKYKTDNSAADEAVPAGTFTTTKNYQFGSEIFRVDTITQNNDSTTLGITRAQNGTTATAQQEDVPLYGTDITITNNLTLSKTTGTYQSTPGLFDIQLNDYIIAAQSGVVAQITATSTYQDPVTQEFIGQVNISPGSSFFGLLFNRITSTSYPNVVLDDISKSQVNIVNYTDNDTPFNENFPANEQINNYVIPYDNASGALVENETIRNYKIEYGNSSGDFAASEEGKVRKITFKDKKGSGFFVAGQVIRTPDTKAEVVGYSQARQTVYVGKIGRSKASGEDYHDIIFHNSAQIDTAQKKFGTASLLLDSATTDYVNIATSSEFAWTTNAFTIEFWVRADASSLSGTATLFDQRANATEVAIRIYLEAGQIRYNVNGSDLVTSGATTLNNNVWYHVAVQRSSTTSKILLNGAEVGTGTDSSNFPQKPIRIGADYAGANGFKGHIDELRVSPTARYSTLPFTAATGIHQGDANAKLLIHFDGPDGVNYTEDWSGGESFTAGEEFNNDSILASTRAIGKHTYDGGTSSNAITITAGSVQKDVTAATYDHTTGVLVLTIGSHSYTTSDTLTIGANKLSFTCSLDNNATSHTYPRTTDPAYGTALAITAVTGTTVTVNVGIASKGFVGNSHRYLDAADLLVSNIDFIKNETVHIMKEVYTQHTVKGSEADCEDDVRDVVNSLVDDLRNGSNSHMWTAASYYVDRTTNPIQIQASTVEADVSMTVFAYEVMDKMVRFIVNNVPWEIQGDHGFIQKFDATLTESDYGGLVQKTPTNADYDPVTGELTLTVSSHGLAAPRTITATGSTYTATTGVLTIVSNGHNLVQGDRIKFKPNSIVFNCTSDGNTVNQSYPRSDDPAGQGWLEVTYIDANNFSVNVGKSPTVSYTPTAGVYDAETGFLTFNIGDNDLKPGSKYTPTGVAYTASSGAMTITIDNNFDVNNADYDGDTGDLELWIGPHSLDIGTQVKIANNSLFFKCSMDEERAIHAYPRSGDPVSGQDLEITKITDKSIVVNVGATPIVNYTPTGAAFTPATGEMVLTIGTHDIAVGDSIKLIDGSIEFSCGAGAGNHSYPRTLTDDISATGATYNGTTGLLTITSAGHGLTAPNKITPTGASYNASTGIMRITKSTHNYKVGDRVKLEDGAITFQCTMDNNATNHAYPRPSDPISGQWVSIVAVPDNNNFDIPVGASALGNYTHSFVSATTDGVKKCNDVVKLEDGAITFKCTQDGGATNHAYPRSTDPISGKWMNVEEVAGNDFTIQVLDSIPSTNTTTHTYVTSTTNGIKKKRDPFQGTAITVESVVANTSITINVGISSNTTTHTFQSAVSGAVISGGNYAHTFVSAATGAVIGNHGFHIGDRVMFDRNSLVFTCDMDGNATEHAYPRTTDPKYNTWLPISSVTTNTFDVNVGASPLVTFTPTGATYNPTSGELVLTIGSHSLSVGENIEILANGLTFSCTQGSLGNGSYPRAAGAGTNSGADYAYNTSLEILAVGATTITVNVNGGRGPITNLTTHTFVSATSGCIVSGGNYTHTFKYALPNSMTRAGETLRIVKDGISFECDQDNYKTIHSYPRGDDPGYNTSLPIYNNGIEMTAENASYNPATGEMTITIIGHGMTTTDQIRIENHSLGFTCTRDGNKKVASYPRLTDPYQGRWLRITAVTENTFTVNVGFDALVGNQYVHTFVSAVPHGIVKRDNTITVNIGKSPVVDYTPTDASYNATTGALELTIGAHSLPAPTTHTVTDANYVPSTGIMTLTIAGHGFSNGEKIKLADDSLTFTCTHGSGNKTYPRSTDPISKKWVPISNVTTNTFDVQVLAEIPSTNVTPHTFQSATSGGLSKANSTVKLAPNSLKMTCDQDSDATVHTYPRAEQSRHTASAGTLYNPSTGIMTITTASAHGFAVGTPIRFEPNSLKFTCTKDQDQTEHTYPRATDPATNRWFFVESVPSSTTFKVQVLDTIPSTNITNHTFVSAEKGGIVEGDPLVAQAIPVDAVTGTTITINTLDGYTASNTTTHAWVGVNYNQYTPSAATYTPTTGDLELTIPTTNFTPTAVSYTPASGVMVLTIGSHTLSVGDTIRIDANSLTFTCDFNSDGDTTEKTYPRATGASTFSGADYAYNRDLTIIDEAATTITVNVNGDATTITDTTTHNFVAGSENTNCIKVGHQMKNGEKIKITNNSLNFRCNMGDDAGLHSYPRATDPVNNRWLEISNVDYNKFTVNVGKSPLKNYTPSDIDYNPTSGIMKMTIGRHDLRKGQSIKIATSSLKFRCAHDDYATDHSYPRTTVNTITPTTAAYDTGNGRITITVNGHGLGNGDWVKLADNALTFSCAFGGASGSAAEKSYPRSTDPISGKWLRVENAQTNTFDILVLDTLPSTNTDAHSFVSAVSGGVSVKKDSSYDAPVEITEVTDTTISVKVVKKTPSTNTTNHIFVAATANAITAGGNYTHTFVKADTNSITRAMLYTGGGYNHRFVSGLANAITTGGDYVHTFQSADTNGIVCAGDAIFIAPNSLTFKCAQDNFATNHTYPRLTDPSYNQLLPITKASTNTFTVNVNPSPINDQYAHTFVSSTSDCITKSQFSLADCSDVTSTANNLVTILTDTLNSAVLASPVDHLATITKQEPKAEFVGGTIDSYREVGFPVSYHDGTSDLIYTAQIDADTQYRFRDAAELIRANRGVIVDKAAFDMLTRYPDLALDMPRNANGTSTDGTLRCKTDLGLIVDAIANDIEDGGNEKSVEAANFYLGNNNELLHIRLQVWQSIYAHDRIGVYVKQAITGDLTYDNTDDIIVGDWDITDNSGSGNCANVATAVDTLITTINDMIAPTGNDYNIGGNRLYFNRKYIAEECTGYTSTEFNYTLNAITYNAFSYPGAAGETTCQRDLKLIIESICSDLQTGGNNSTIAAMEKYLDAALQIGQVEEELLATAFAINKIKEIGGYVLNNVQYDFNSGEQSPNYAAQYSNTDAVRDTETPTDIASVIDRFEYLVDVARDIIAPAKSTGRSAGKNILFNYNYYKEELTQQVNTQFGAGSWTYDSFLTNIINDMCHDIATTDITDKKDAREITLSSVYNSFQVGEIVYSSNGAYSEVLEWDDDTQFLVVGPFTGPTWVANNTLTGQTSNAVAVISAIGPKYDWYNTPCNVQTLAHARTLGSNITGEVPGTNLYSNPEALASDWTSTETTFTNNAIASPDLNVTAEKVIPSTNTGLHTISRNYSLTAYDTFDDGTIKWDTSGQKFDEGAAGTNATQTFTFSMFVKAAGYTSLRFQMSLDEGTAAVQRIFFDLNLTAGTIGTVFTPQGGMTNDAAGVVPLGNGWFRCYITTTFSFGFTTLQNKIIVNNAAGAQSYAGNGTDGIYAWGAKLTKTALDPYQSGDGTIFYSDATYNINNYTFDILEDYISQALQNGLTQPSPNAGFYKYFDATAFADYNERSIHRLVRYQLNILRNQIKTGTYFTQININNGVSLPTKTYGTRTLPIGVSGGLNNADFMYGTSSDSYGELESLSENSGKVVQVYQRFRIDGDITDGPFTMNEVVAKQGAPSITGVVYGFYEDANYKYLDVKVTAGPWAITDNVVGATNSTTAQISAIEDRIHVIDLKGTFEDNIPFKGYDSGKTAQPAGSFLKNEAAVLDNTGGTLTVDTETLLGSFELNSVVYPESSRQYLDVIKYAGLDIGVGSKIASVGYIRLQVSIISNLNVFTVGNRLYKVVSGIQDPNTYAIITEVDLDNNYIYAIEYQGNPFQNGDVIGDYGLSSNFPVGYATITTKVTTAGAASAVVQGIKTVGTLKRLYLSDINGTFSTRDAIKSIDGYKSVISIKGDLKARVKRSFKGFDGTQTTFNLSQNNGTSYLPDPEGHLLIFINGILQPPGATNAYTAFSNQIQFTESPELGASFTGFYVGKLRQLDDISFDFDSLRQSFNLKRNNVFYSLTLTEGVQSSTIRPENNIIVSLNGVIQEPGIGFEIVGSRIIFSEIPRVGSTFVAFSYVGSEADVDAAEIVPPVEPGDFIDIQGETEAREVAVIESSNSLITFDYLGSVFGQDASASAALTSGFIKSVQVTAGGSSYTTRPTVRVDSISGFEGNIRALVGVAGVEISNPGSNYQNPDIAVETTVPDDWTAPDLSSYGEEEVDPETPINN